jgi:hypothetical protein
MTDVGEAIFIKKLSTIEFENYSTKGSIGLFILLDNDKKPDCYALLWEGGGDWTGFGDDDRHAAENLNGWEPDEIRYAITEAAKLGNEDINEDMEWFLDWADTAEQILEENNN